MIQNLDIRINTLEHGVVKFISISSIQDVVDNSRFPGTWDNFVQLVGMSNDELFDLSWALEYPDGTYTRRYTLTNGNYLIITFAYSDNRTHYTIDITAYYANGTEAFTLVHTSGGFVSSSIRLTNYVIVYCYNDTRDRLARFQISKWNVNDYVERTFIEYIIPFADFTSWLEGSIVGPDPYSTDDNQTPSGGYGDFNFTGDDDLPPVLPSASASQVGFVSLWNPTQQEMKDLASYMWSNSIFDVSTWKKLFADPMECILSVGIIPVNPSISAAKENIQIGNISTNVQAYRITNQFVSVDFGKINLKGQSASYMDYAPYCRASIYLPYCGDFALNVDDIMDAEMSLEYHIDIYTGACVAYLSIRRTNSDGSVLNSTLYQFTGNVLSSIPITASDHSAFIQSLLFMGAGIAATVATGGAGAPAIAGASAAGDVAIGGAAAGLTAGSAINTVMSMKPDVQRSGNLSSTAGFLGKQKPCLTIHWSNLCRPSDEYKLLGMPLHKSGTLSDFSGFTIVSAVHMDDIPCTADELKLIEEALYKGVII